MGDNESGSHYLAKVGHNLQTMLLPGSWSLSLLPYSPVHVYQALRTL